MHKPNPNYGRPIKVKKWNKDKMEFVEIDVVAIFHEWGLDYEEHEYVNGIYSIAIFEWPNGKVDICLADHVRFLDKDPESPYYKK